MHGFFQKISNILNIPIENIIRNGAIAKFCDNCPFKQTTFFLHFVSLALGTHVYYSCELRNKSVILMLKDKKMN